MGSARDPETGAELPAPWELTELALCKLYGCLPSELDQEEWERIERHLTILNVIEELKALKP